MDQNHFTADTLRKKGAHLTFEERVIIQTRFRDKQSYRSIAREIGCCVNTVRNEVDHCNGRSILFFPLKMCYDKHCVSS